MIDAKQHPPLVLPSDRSESMTEYIVNDFVLPWDILNQSIFLMVGAWGAPEDGRERDSG